MTTALAPAYGRRRLLRSGDTLRLVRPGRAELTAPVVIGPVTISALPQTANLLLYQGDTFFLQTSVWDPDGEPVPLDQTTPRAQIRTAVADTDPVVLAEFATSILDNQITLFLSTAQTTPLHGAAVWDVQITDPNNWVTTLAAGTVHITQEVTR